MEGFIRNRLSDPETVFGDEWMLRMNLNHPRAQPLTEETLRQIDLDAAMEIYRDRFADAGDFTFVLVGNFQPRGIEPLVLKYLGGLPSTGREENWRDVGVQRAEGVVRFDVKKGLEPKSQVRLTFHDDAEWSRQNSHDIRSLASLLRIRLREVLREDKGGTYGVGVWGYIERRPRERYALSVNFGCAPENVEELIDAVFEEIEALKENGPEESYLQKVREGQIRERETDLKENGFWQNWLVSAYRYEMDPRLVLSYDELVESVTVERMQDAARRYLNTDRYMLGALWPEEQAEP
jgi:zinc protease